MESLMKRISIGSLLLLLILCIWAKPASKQESFKLIHSDKLFLNRMHNEQVLELSGKVHFFYGDTEFKSDRAYLFDTSKVARLDGNVRVSNDSLAIVADSVAYYRYSEELNLGGKVRITEQRKDGSFRWFESDYGVYRRDLDQLTVWKDVRAWDKDEDALASCGYAFWDRKAGYAYMIEEPQIRSNAPDSLFIRADKIEYHHEDRKIIATFNAFVSSVDYQVKSDFLIYLLNEEKVVFTGKPSFSSDYAIATAEEFYLYLDERKLQRAELQDRCRVFFSQERGGEKENVVEAGFVSLAFQDDGIESFSASNKVSYSFHRPEGEKEDEFFNVAKGEFLEAKFTSDNKLELMRMSQGIRGSYKFYNKP